MQKNNTQQNPLAERLLFPLLAVALAVSMLWEQIEGSYRAESKYYVIAIALPVLVLALVDIIRNIRSSILVRSSKEATEGLGLLERPYVRPLIVSAFSFVGLYYMQELGYLLVFAGLIAIIMYLTGESSIKKIALVIAACLLVAHFGFVGVIGLDLPYGSLFGME